MSFAAIMKSKRVRKLMFPLFLFLFEVVFVLLYGLLVRYDDGGSPHHDLEELKAHLAEGGTSEEFIQSLVSTLSTTKTYPLFQDVHVMIFIGFGFLMTFLRRYGYGSVAFNLLVAAFAIQWSTLTGGFFTFIDQALNNVCCTIHVNIESMVATDFGAAATLITMGAVLGRASPFQLIIITFFELVFYSSNEAINIYVFKAADIGGSMIIHTFGAYFGLAVSVMLYRKAARDHSKNSTVYHSDLFAMIGTIFLWMYWPSFNGALASGNAQYRAIINTYYAMTGSVISSFLFSMVFNSKVKLNMTHIQNATLAGGVAVGSIADMVLQPWGAIVIGVLAGLISVIGYQFLSSILEKIYIQDTCGVHNLHGMPGVFSGIASAIAAGLANIEGGDGTVAYGNSLYLVFPARAPRNISDLAGLGVEPSQGRSAGVQAGFQLALLISTLIISIGGGLVTGAVVGYLPLFNKLEDKVLFDDEDKWELPDDAHQYLPVNNSDEVDDDVEVGVRQRYTLGLNIQDELKEPHKHVAATSTTV